MYDMYIVNYQIYVFPALHRPKHNDILKRSFQHSMLHCHLHKYIAHPFFSKNSLSGCDTTSISFPGAILRNEQEDTALREEEVVIGCPINALVAEDKRTTADTTFAIVLFVVLFVVCCGVLR